MSWKVYALRYAMRDARRHEHFIGGDPHDAPMPMDYFVWAMVRDGQAIVLDTGFTEPVAKKRGRMTYADRVVFHDGDAELASGITLHVAAGHSAGLQCVRVETDRGQVVLASDVTHFHENMETGRPFTTAFHVGGMLDGFDLLRALATSAAHIIPGHDPEVMRRYPAVPGLEGIAMELHRAPVA